MQISRLHRYALALAVCTLLLVISGAVVTGNTGNQPGAQPSGPEQFVHRIVAGGVALLTIGLAFALARVPKRPLFARLGFAALALVVLQAALGMLAPSAGAIHAILAQVFFALTVAIVAVTTTEPQGEIEIVKDHMRPSMATVANITLAMVLVQITLGAAVRHKLLGVLSHIGFAVLVALAALMLGMCVLHQAPQHKPLRPAAILLMVITGVQVFLGFAAFILKLMIAETALAAVIVTTAHVTTAALTLGATLMLRLHIQHYMRSAAPQRATVAS
jgi:heme A synthase